MGSCFLHLPEEYTFTGTKDLKSDALHADGAQQNDCQKKQTKSYFRSLSHFKLEKGHMRDLLAFRDQRRM